MNNKIFWEIVQFPPYRNIFVKEAQDNVVLAGGANQKLFNPKTPPKFNISIIDFLSMKFEVLLWNF